MAEERFTKEKAAEAKNALGEMFDAIPKTRRYDWFGHLNEIAHFIEAAARAAPAAPPSNKGEE